MKVLILKPSHSIGQRGDIIDVSEGHARNFLFPQKIAVPLDSSEGKLSLAKVKSQKNERSRIQKARMALFKKIDGCQLEFSRPANEDGHLYESVTAEDIARSLALTFKLPLFDSGRIEPRSPIKRNGRHLVRIRDKDDIYQINIIIKSQKSHDEKTN